jgi:hypothetical protein
MKVKLKTFLYKFSDVSRNSRHLGWVILDDCKYGLKFIFILMICHLRQNIIRHIFSDKY